MILQLPLVVAPRADGSHNAAAAIIVRPYAKEQSLRSPLVFTLSPLHKYLVFAARNL